MRVVLLLLTELSLFSFWLGLWSLFENVGITKSFVFSVTSSVAGFISLVGLTVLLYREDDRKEKKSLNSIIECVQKSKTKQRLRNV